jgi:hypothetical protein
MIFKICSGIVAVALMLAYVLAPAIKLKHGALAAVIAIGVVLMLIDWWQSIKEKE